MSDCKDEKFFNTEFLRVYSILKSFYKKVRVKFEGIYDKLHIGKNNVT